MKQLGGLMVFFGVFAIVLGFMDRAPRLMMWVYNWGGGAAWAIKIAFVVVGALVYLAGSRRQTS